MKLIFFSLLAALALLPIACSPTSKPGANSDEADADTGTAGTASTSGPTPTPHPATAAMEIATKLYPDLAKRDSLFNRTFRDIYAEKLTRNPWALQKADWPVTLAHQTGRMLNVRAGATPEPNWFDKRLQQKQSLESPSQKSRAGSARPSTMLDR